MAATLKAAKDKMPIFELINNIFKTSERFRHN
jgi:hypothetical protein